MLTQMGHPQTTTLIKTDNATANSFVQEYIIKKKLKSSDMRFIGYGTNNKTSILTSIRMMVTITLLIMTQSITQRNTKYTPEKYMHGKY